MAERLSQSLQENVITLLCYDDEAARVIVSLVDPALFEGDYREVAQRFMKFFRDYKEAPKSHAADQFPEITDKHDRSGAIYKRILRQMLSLKQDINRQFVLDSLQKFVRVQRLKATSLEMAQVLQAKDADGIEEAEKKMSDALRSRDIAFIPGLRLTDYRRVLDKLRQQETEFLTGIRELDQRYIVPYREAVMLLLGSAKAGKTWGLIHLGKMALLQHKKVLHITLEMGEEPVAARYYQSLFSIPRRQAELGLTIPHLDISDRGKMLDLLKEDANPEFALDSAHAYEELEQRLSWRGRRYDDLIVKGFPPRRLTMQMLEGYLDNLEIVDGFIPDMLILDYIGIVNTDAKNHRISLGRAFEDYRGICVDRGIAGATAHQLSKKGDNASHVEGSAVAEDWSMIGTADQVVVYQATREEKRRGLCRLWVDRARNEKDKFAVLMTQAYAVGQFCLSSAFMPVDYFEFLKDSDDNDGDDDSDD